jgi:hypothetical protein
MAKMSRVPAQEQPERASPAGLMEPEGLLLEYGNAFAQDILFSGMSRADGPTTAPRGSAPSGGTPPPVASGGLPIRPVITVGSHTQTQTANLAPYPNFFGISTYGVRPTQVSTAAAGDHVQLDIELGVETPWNVQSRGRTDVPSADSPLVTRQSFASIGNDLRPQGIGRPRRDRYWVQHLSERHERFHGTDDYGWTQANAGSVAATALAGQTVSASPSREEVRPLVHSVLQAVARGNDRYYGGEQRGDGDVPGEQRAYGDGRAAYQELYGQIVARARTL